MNVVSRIGLRLSVAIIALSFAACGGSAPDPKNQEDEELDVIGSIVGDVEIDQSLVESPAEQAAAYTGPTTLTVNLKVVDERNPEGSYTLKDAEGKVVIDKGAFGKPQQVNQGAYSVEFSTPLVFGKPLYTVESLQVAGPEQTVDEVFPAGRITLNTYRGATFKKCTPLPFTVVRKEGEEAVAGTGKTCAPLVIQAGHYELRLQLTKKKYQPVEIRVNKEQMSESPIKIED
ncbi:MAG TPA: hypothetical protein VM285_09555 [Polyangia bacterium]|nr:hypothetical protein [Polyangia bacterium]